MKRAEASRFSNEATRTLALYIANDEHLYNQCKSLYEDGYKTWGSMGCKLREFGRHWKSINNPNSVDLLKDIRAKEITELLVDLFEPEKNEQHR